MTALWTAEDIEKATGGRATSSFDAQGVSIDTRTLRPGDLFVALTDVRDGHDFVSVALKNGAAGALVSRIPKGVSDEAPLIVVDDVLNALEDMGRFARARISGKVIAITGSAGKTSTKDMLLSVLSKQGRVSGSEASYNNHWGVPLTLARTPQDVDFAVIEIGMNHPGEIAPLSKMAAPDVAIVTTIALTHLAAFSGIEAIAKEKASIFEGLVDGGVSIVNLDVNPAGIVSDAAADTMLSFGTDEGADFRQRFGSLHVLCP